MPDLVNLTIDGQKTSVAKGALVIEAATQLGIDVPRFCYHPKLSAVGMCRMCLGEVGMPKMNPDRTPALNQDGTPQIAMMPKPQTLCTTQAAEGMVVLTETPAVVKMRQGVLEFFLANHPLDCPICDKGGECMLQDQSMAYANGESRVRDMYALRKHLDKNYPLSELITLDRERCIQCARCTRFCSEIAQDPVLELVARGSHTMIDTLSTPPFDTKFSGNTIDICPVGALTSRAFRFRSRVWELTNVPTVSMVDGCGTNIFVCQRNETLVRIIPRDNEAINECWISDRDRFGLDYVDSEARLTQPLVRRGDALAPATWDEALQLVADKIKSAGPGAVAAVGGPKLTNEGALAMARLFRDVVGTPHLDHAWKPALVSPGKASPTFYEDIEAADVVLILGANPNEELPILDLRLKKAAFARKVHLINCNVIKTPLDKVARQAFVHTEGTEVALVNAFAKLVHQSWTDEPAKSEKLHAVGGQAGAQTWLDTLAPYASTRVAEICGVDEANLRAASTAIANSERLIIFVGEGATPATLQALSNLAALKGRTDYLMVLHPDPNTVGVRRAGLVPGEGGKTGAAILEAAAQGAVKVLFMAGTNPLHRAADGELARRALEKAEFVVVQAILESDLTACADVVLPAASFLEQDGTTTNCSGKVQNLKQVFRPRVRRDSQGATLSACAPDWMIFSKLAQLLGTDWQFYSAGAWTADFEALPSAPAAQVEFREVNYEAPPGGLPEGSLRLVSGSLLYDGGESFTHCERLNRVVPQPFALINRADAARLGIENDALVELETTRGKVRVLARVGRLAKPGTLWLPVRSHHVCANQLIEVGQAATSVTVTKIADAPVQPAVSLAAHSAQSSPAASAGGGG